MTEATLNQHGIATMPGGVTVYNYDSETREYLSVSVEFLAVGVGTPANSCTDAPGVVKEGYAICRNSDGTAWEYLADHRGEKVFDTDTGNEVLIILPGDYPEGTTPQSPTTEYDYWDGEQWVTDEAKQHVNEVAAAEYKKADLLTAARSEISVWQTELQLELISDDDKASLINWMSYIKALQAVDTNTAPDISWPSVS